MKHLESPIEQEVVRKAKARGVIGLKLSSQFETGLPDRLFIIPGGRPLFIEFKRPGDEPRPKQRHWHELLRKLGYEVQVHDNVKLALRAITAAVEAAQLSEEGN